MGVEARIAALYGDVAVASLPRATGLIHVAAIWSGGTDESAWPAILIREDSPRSADDRFALELARARADAIVITGQIVRDEPELSYGPPGQGTDYAAELLAWREHTLVKTTPPRLVILTRRANFDFDHPVFQSWAWPLVFTEEARAEALRRELDGRALEVEVVGHPAPSLAAAIEHLGRARAETISLEAGPSVLAPLYAGEGPRLDELMLSLYDGPLDPALRGPSFADPSQVELAFERVSATLGDEHWTITRWRARG